MTLTYAITRIISFTLFKILFRIEVVGKENVPAKGSVLVASNHASYLDPVLLGCVLDRMVYFVARESLFKNKMFGALLRSLGVIPIKRGAFDKNVFKTIFDKLIEEEKCLCIFIEGTRTKTGELGEPKPGLGFIAHKTNSVIVPAYIKGSFDAFPRGTFIIRPVKIKVFYGKPILLSEIKIDENMVEHEKCKVISNFVMERIKELKAIR